MAQRNAGPSRVLTRLRRPRYPRPSRRAPSATSRRSGRFPIHHPFPHRCSTRKRNRTRLDADAPGVPDPRPPCGQADDCSVSLRFGTRPSNARLVDTLLGTSIPTCCRPALLCPLYTPVVTGPDRRRAMQGEMPGRSAVASSEQQDVPQRSRYLQGLRHPETARSRLGGRRHLTPGACRPRMSSSTMRKAA
jgi:hypothetical protein